MADSEITLDFQRTERIGFEEAIFSQGKTVEQLNGILDRAKAKGASLLRNEQPDRFDDIKEDILSFRARLEMLNAQPGDLQVKYRGQHVAMFVLRNLGAILLGFPLFALGVALVPGAPRPAIIIDAEGFTVAARGADGRMRVVSPRGNRFTVQRWLSSDGDARIASDNSLMAGVRCDTFGCAMPLPEGGRIAVPRQPEAVADDCHEARVVVTRFAVPANCRARVIDTRALAWTGAVRLFREGDSYRVETARPASGTRPWFRPRPAGEPIPLLRPTPGSQSAPPAQPAADDGADPPADADQ